jgi:hypothetical protein
MGSPFACHDISPGWYFDRTSSALLIVAVDDEEEEEDEDDISVDAMINIYYDKRGGRIVSRCPYTVGEMRCAAMCCDAMRCSLIRDDRYDDARWSGSSSCN